MSEIEMSAESAPVELAWRRRRRRGMFGPRTTLVVVDMQNIFIEPREGEPNPGAEDVLQQVNQLVDRAQREGSPVVYTRDYGPTDIAADDPLCDLHPSLDVRGYVVEKGPGRLGGFSAFICLGNEESGPGRGALGELHRVLQDAAAERLVICGFAVDVCVAATAQDARRLGYGVTIPLWATAFVHAHPRGDADALRDLVRGGVTVEAGPSAWLEDQSEREQSIRPQMRRTDAPCTPIVIFRQRWDVRPTCRSIVQPKTPNIVAGSGQPPFRERSGDLHRASVDPVTRFQGHAGAGHQVRGLGGRVRRWRACASPCRPGIECGLAGSQRAPDDLRYHARLGTIALALQRGSGWQSAGF